MNKYIDVKGFVVFIIITMVVAFMMAKFTGISFLLSCLIVGGAILLNGLVMVMLGDNDK